MRTEIIGRAILLLERRGFFVSSFMHTNSCFDLIARNGSTLLIKVYSNIDGVREGQARELSRLGKVLRASALIVGNRSKAFVLRDSVVYERYGVPTVSLNTLEDFLDNKAPGVRCFKGREVVEIDAERLREKRKSIGLSLCELAEKAKTSAESIHRYEKGAGASAGTAKRLEEVLHTSIIRDIGLFGKRGGEEKFDREMEDEALAKIQRLGIDLAEFQHAPFRAYSKPGRDLLIGRGNAGREVRHSAMQLKKTKQALGSDGMVLAREFKHDTIGEIPVVKEEELDSLSRGKDLIELMKEKKRKK